MVQRRYLEQGEFEVSGAVKTYYATDHLGSVRDLLSASGQKLASYDYDAYGRLTQNSSGSGADFRYAGMFYHAPGQLYLTWYRAYDPSTARWLSQDPIGLKGGSNR